MPGEVREERKQSPLVISPAPGPHIRAGGKVGQNPFSLKKPADISSGGRDSVGLWKPTAEGLYSFYAKPEPAEHGIYRTPVTNLSLPFSSLAKKGAFRRRTREALPPSLHCSLGTIPSSLSSLLLAGTGGGGQGLPGGEMDEICQLRHRKL